MPTFFFALNSFLALITSEWRIFVDENISKCSVNDLDNNLFKDFKAKNHLGSFVFY